MGEKARLASAGSDIKLWEMPGFAMTNSISPHSQPVTSLCWGNNNQNLVSVGGDKVVVTYLKSGINNSTELAVGDGYTCAAFNSTSRYLLLGGKTKSISVWDWKSKNVKKTYKEHKDAVSCLTFNWNDTSIASGAVDGNILLHNVVTGQASAPLRQPKTQAIRGLQYSLFKKSLLASASDDGALNMWDTNARKLVTSFSSDHKAPATGLCFSPVNEMLLVSVGLDRKIVFYDAQGKKSVKVMTADAPLTAVDFLHDGVTLAVGTTRGKIYIYDLRSGSAPIAVQAAHMSSVQCLKFEQSLSSSAKSTVTPANKFTKSVTSVSNKPKISSRNLPEDPQGPQNPNVVSQSNDAKPPVQQQNGIKDEDIFSPLREAKAPMATSVQLEDRTAIPPPAGFEHHGMSLVMTKDKTLDGSGIFSPLASNSSTSDVRHHPVGGPAYSPIEFPSPRTTGDLTSSGSRVQADSHPGTTESTTPSSRSIDRNQKLNDLRDIRYKLQSADVGPDSVNTPPESSASNLRVASESSPTVSRHSSNSSDIRPWPESDLTRNEGRARLEGRSDTGLGVAGYQGDVNQSLDRGSARSSRSSSGGSPLQYGRRLSNDSIGDKRDGLDAPDILKKGNNIVYANGDAAAYNNAGLQPFQIEFIKNMIDESMDEFRVAIHKDVVNLQVEMLRQFQIQQNELREMMEKYSVNEALVQEIDRLREENRRLKTKY